jgi:hypothetical protein
MNEHDDIFKPNDFTNDKKNQGSVNPKSENADFGDYTPPENTIDKSQGELYEKYSNTREKIDTDQYTNKKTRVYTNTTLTPELLDLSSLFSARRKDSKVIMIRLNEKIYAYIQKKASEAKVSAGTWLRYRIIADYLAETLKGIDVNQTLDFGLLPKTVIPVNLAISVVNNNVGTNPRFEKELLEPRLKAKLRKVCEEILSGAPKIRKFNPQKFDYDYILPPLEEQKKWYKEKEAQMLNIIKTLGKLKVQLDPELESLFKKTSEKLWEVDA